ncbi:MAG TPA: ATP-binding cassette domain-containing protein [Thermoanaerobaculia bacterium]|jgi:ATPase subunit of ABC transporter with duplicated ATPase domains|nr:ATP-binding cassette domain-containing protein [Thermoanaerobaculia bacterium]
MIAVSDLGKAYGPQTLFEGVSIQFNPGNRYGLVGANGSGKSTFLKILAGDEIPSEGTVAMPKRLKLGVLKQDHFRYEHMPILEVAMMGNHDVWEAMVEKERILAVADQEFDADRYAEVEDLILRNDGYTLESRAGEVLEGLGIPTEVHRQPLSTLSGGFKLRVLLAQVLAADPDVLLLDEPTNHLDILSIRWLEKFLVDTYKGTALVISHDHRFLDNICTHIVDVDYETMILYPGNYTAFMSAKVENRDRKEAEIEKREAEIARHKEFVDRFRAKATKARQAQSKIKMIEKIVIDRLPTSSRRYPTFKFKQVRPSGRQALELEGISKSYGDKQVLKDVSLKVERGDRIAIIGPNGIGKSTLLKIAVGDTEADAGRIEWGYETYPGYFSQDHNEVPKGSKQSVEAWLWEFVPGEPIGFVRGNLGMVLFSGDDVKKPIGSLSGGEAARLVFCKLSVTKPNVLILDEPTNHLDLEAIEALVEGLRSYDGTLIFVSHDRWFVSQLANRIFEISPRGINDFRGTYDEYLERLGDDHLDAEAVLRMKREQKKKAAASAAAPAVTDPAEARRRQQRQKELGKKLDQVTAAVEQAESRINAINEMFCDPTFFDRTSRDQVKKLETEQKTLSTKVEELMGDWERIETEMGELGA